MIPALAVLATCAEIVLGLLLLAGWTNADHRFVQWNSSDHVWLDDDTGVRN